MAFEFTLARFVLLIKSFEFSYVYVLDYVV
jgi:hypothetical protein